MFNRKLRVEIVEAICKVVVPKSKWDDSCIERKTHLFVIRYTS